MANPLTMNDVQALENTLDAETALRLRATVQALEYQRQDNERLFNKAHAEMDFLLGLIDKMKVELDEAMVALNKLS